MMDYIFEAREGWCGTGWRMLYIPRCCGTEDGWRMADVLIWFMGHMM